MNVDEKAQCCLEITLKDLRDHAWDYFEFHADQRLKTFHFFILLETGLVGATLISARVATGPIAPALVSTIGFIVALLAYIFWELDVRVKGMIKVSEGALKAYEKAAINLLGDTEATNSTPFLNDPQVKGNVGLSPFGVLSYSKCFGVVFICFFALGLAIALRLFT